jgi:hypothetical protein
LKVVAHVTKKPALGGLLVVSVARSGWGLDGLDEALRRLCDGLSGESEVLSGSRKVDQHLIGL